MSKHTTFCDWRLRGLFLNNHLTFLILRNVQVTLHILSAIIEKCPRDLSLYIAAAFGIMQTILQSNDITLIEYSVPTFEILCTHQDYASLTSEKGLLPQFEVLLRSYASYASKSSAIARNSLSSLPLRVRYRKAGLQAIRGAVPSISIWASTEKLISLIVPIVLENVDSGDPQYIIALQERIASRDEMERDFNYKRKQSMSTVWTEDTVEADPQAASGTIENADKLAEEEVGVVALQALRLLYTAVNRSQLRWVTSAMLEYFLNRSEVNELKIGLDSSSAVHTSWPMYIAELSCDWARVQDRFTILITSVDLLSMTDHHLKKQLVLASIVESLLCSSINFIGLSVLDVLTSLIQEILLHIRKMENDRYDVLQTQPLSSAEISSLSGTDVNTSSHEANGCGESGTILIRARVIGQIRKCIAGLATHVYYSDQISDMISKILERLKPSASPLPLTGSLAVQGPMPKEDTQAKGGDGQEKPPEKLFPPGMGRLTALIAVKEIITVANSRFLDGTYGAVSRSKVAISVWEGTEWLLHDPHAKVRRMYIDSLLSWLQLEVGKEAMRLPEEGNFGVKHNKGIFDETKASGLSRRAMLTIMQQDGSPKRQRRRFLRSLHLAIYEIALQQAESESNILLLHLLLVKMIEHLGVNALRDGLPMMMRLQEDIQIVVPASLRIRIGSLVYGYLQAICVVFDFEHNLIGREIHNEIGRRKDKGIWMKRISVPPQSLEQIESLDNWQSNNLEDSKYGDVDSLKPFEQREQLIDRISFAYSTMLAAPPSSPTGRMLSRSFSAQLGSSSISSIGLSGQAYQLPSKFREELLSDWTKEACLAHATRESSRSGSLNGSRKVANGNSRDLLAVAIPSGNVGFSLNSPVSGDVYSRNNNHNDFQHGGLLRSNSSYRRPSTTARQEKGGAASPYGSENRASGQGSPLQLSTSSIRSSIRVEDLKRALSTSSASYNSRPKWQRNAHPHDITEDTASESMVSADLSASDTSVAGRTAISDAKTSAGMQEEPPSTPKSPQTSHHSSFVSHGSSPPASAARELPSDLQKEPDMSEDVPPVPPLPASLQAAMRVSLPAQSTVATVDHHRAVPSTINIGGASAVANNTNTGAASTSTYTSAGTSVHKSKSLKGLRASSNPPGGSQRTMPRKLTSSVDFSGLLNSINVEDDEQENSRFVDRNSRRSMFHPPY